MKRSTWVSSADAKMTEADHQMAIITRRDLIVRAKQEGHEALRWLHAIPNGSKRDAYYGKMLKAQGLTKGVCDLMLDVKSKGYSGLRIELKSATGKPTVEQKEYLTFCADQGFQAMVCYGYRDAWRVICNYLSIENKYENETDDVS